MIFSKKIGIIGGGQLGKMMIAEAKKLGFYVAVLDPAPDCPCSKICDLHIQKNFDDKNAVIELANNVDVITYEFEHIGSDILIELENQNKQVFPTAKSLKIIQNKYLQKSVLKQNNLPVSDFKEVKSLEDIENSIEEYSLPVILKNCFGGYDGKGNYLIKDKSEIQKAFESLGEKNLMLEKFVSFEKEISILACRGQDGNIVVYPVAENIHQNNILIETRVPAEISLELQKKAHELAYNVMEVFDGIGMFCVELFVTKYGKIYINEVAPRPHNSGHYTIEACITSQFENHIRAIVGLPLGNPNLIKSAIMLNILGQENYQGEPKYDNLEKIFVFGGAKVHIYGKKLSTPKRKLGHVTICASSSDECRKIAKICEEFL